MDTIPNVEILWEVPAAEQLIGITLWHDLVIIATDRKVYKMIPDSPMGPIVEPIELYDKKGGDNK